MLKSINKYLNSYVMVTINTIHLLVDYIRFIKDMINLPLNHILLIEIK